MIEIINAKVGLMKVILRASQALEDLEEKTPHKKELIINQKDSLMELDYTKNILHRLDLKCMAQSNQIHSLNTLNLELKEENTKLHNTIKNLLNDEDEILKNEM
tara:strand:- start:840 stop:1151 length:312 start_codon:yes stop_codon:yes gene_type:complete